MQNFTYMYRDKRVVGSFRIILRENLNFSKSFIILHIIGTGYTPVRLKPGAVPPP